MTPIYRPPGYGPAPTEEEHDAAIAPRMHAKTRWLVTSPAPDCDWDFPLRIEIVSVYRDQGVVMAVGEGARWTLAQATELFPLRMWCLLDPGTGLPCSIGTPPETERERLEKAMVDVHRNESGVWELARRAAALADHIIKETTR